MDLKCFSAPRAAKQQQQLTEVQAIEPLLSGLPAPPAFAQFLSPWSRSATNALCPSSPKRSVNITCSETESRGSPSGEEAAAGAGSPAGAGAAGAVPGPYLR